jgi:hypothetical protein
MGLHIFMVGRNLIVEPMFVHVLEWMRRLTCVCNAVINGNLEGMGSIFSLYLLGWSYDKAYRHIAMYKKGGRGFSFGQRKKKGVK